MYLCPECNQPTIPWYRKLILNENFPFVCTHCKVKLALKHSGTTVLVFLPVLIGAVITVIPLKEDYNLLRFCAFFVGAAISCFLYVKLIPITKSDR